MRRALEDAVREVARALEVHGEDFSVFLFVCLFFRFFT